MKKRWQTQALSEVCQIRPPKAEARRCLAETDLVSFVPMEDLGVDQKIFLPTQMKPLADVAGSYTYFAEGDVLLAKITPCFENGKLGIAANLTNGIGFGSSEYIVFRPDKTINKEWLYYFLSRESFRAEGAVRMSGAVGHKRVPKEFIEAYPIPVPPLDEQRRIVGILDEAFLGIGKAKANAEKNLQNARALFESHLNSVFTNRCGQWKWVALSDLATDITDGDHMPPPKSPTGVPFITISNIEKDTRRINFSDTFKVSDDYFQRLKPNRRPRKGDVLYTVTGSFGIPVHVDHDSEFCFQRHIGLIRPSAKTDSTWLYYLLLSPQVFKQASVGATGTAQKTVSLKVLRNIKVPQVSLVEQCKIAANLESLSNETYRLESIYKQKLDALNEFKKSLLHQAFTGQLTASSSTQSVSVAIPFPQTLSNISTTDLHTGVLAMAYELHENAGKLDYFSHVKAEKIAHMIEARLGISLGRTPVKDAAGPNDFPHLKKVEHRAKMANFFDFKRVEGCRYRVQKLSGFERLIDKTRLSLGPRLADVESLLQWMLPMKVKQAEIVATVYAGWNNLLLDGKVPTDEEIVREAREDWHPDKLKIEREKFFKAIDWLREQGFIPEGKGQRVMNKEGQVT